MAIGMAGGSMMTLCEFAHRFPLVVATILQQETKLTRGRFREETFTDLMAASLAMLAGPELRIAYPLEKWTGGDIDLCYWHRISGDRLTVRIQAKRLSAATESKRAKAWTYRRYDELDRVVPSTGKYQYRTLSRRHTGIIPLYAFYNHLDFVNLPAVQVLRPIVSGVNLAFATAVRRKLDRHVVPGQTTRFRTSAKRMTEFQPGFFPFTRLFCVPHERTPEPGDIRHNLFGISGEMADDVETEAKFARAIFSDVPDQRSPPGYDESGPFIATSGLVDRPTIFFVSGLIDE